MELFSWHGQEKLSLVREMEEGPQAKQREGEIPEVSFLLTSLWREVLSNKAVCLQQGRQQQPRLYIRQWWV